MNDDVSMNPGIEELSAIEPDGYDGFIEERINAIENNFSHSQTLANGLFPKQTIDIGRVVSKTLLERGIKVSQLRRFVDSLKQIQNLKTWEEQKAQLDLFPIKLVYGEARQKDLKPFTGLLRQIIEKGWVLQKEDFTSLLALIDSIMAHFEYFKSQKENENGGD